MSFVSVIGLDDRTIWAGGVQSWKHPTAAFEWNHSGIGRGLITRASGWPSHLAVACLDVTADDIFVLPVQRHPFSIPGPGTGTLLLTLIHKG